MSDITNIVGLVEARLTVSVHPEVFPQPVSLAKDIAVIVLAVAAAALCVTITVGWIRLLPALRRSVLNLEEVMSSAVGAAPHMVETAVNVKNTTAYLMAAAKDVSQATPVLRWLGPAGATVNVAQHGVGRIAGFIRGLFRR